MDATFAGVAAPAAAARATDWRTLAAKAFGYSLVAAFMALFLAGGTPYSRILYPAVLAIGIINPVWSLYAIALYGPLFLIDPGNTHLLVALEVCILGAFAGELRQLGRQRELALSVTPGTRDHDSVQRDNALGAPELGAWKPWGIALMLMALGSATYGLRLLLSREDAVAGSDSELRWTLDRAFYGWATYPEYTLRSLFNWLTAPLLALLAARRASPLRAARWLKFGALGLVAACLVSHLDRAGLVSLDAFRRPNPDPLHAGRLQGTAGHAGWFALWIVMMWPGVVLWWHGEGRVRRLFVAGALVLVVAPALLLTAARASWLAAAAGAAVGAAYIWRRDPGLRPWIRRGAIAALVVFVAALAASEVVTGRVGTLLRVSDRANYVTSTLALLSVAPLGIGLGTHALQYGWLFPASVSFFQTDHVTAHSIILHPLSENGPFFVALLLGGVVMAGMDVRRSWSAISFGSRRIVLALVLGGGGLVMAGLAQDVIYIRVVELAMWIAGGFIVGLCRREVPELFPPVEPGRARLLLRCALAVAALMALTHSVRAVQGTWPRTPEFDPASGFSFWLDESWRGAVDPETTRISFIAFRKHGEGEVRVRWPDGEREYGYLRAGIGKRFERTFTGMEDLRWLAIRGENPYRISDVEPGSDDRRHATFLITNLVIESPANRHGVVRPKEQ